MKRFWLILLSLGLIAAFSTQAMAVDVKITGEYYAAGMYLDKTTLHKNTDVIRTASPGPSTAFYFQRLRLNGAVDIAPGFRFVTRADIMERAWGAARSNPAVSSGAPGTVLQGLSTTAISEGTDAENENIAFDYAYLNYISPIGIFMVGYSWDKKWGTVFGDGTGANGQIVWGAPLGCLSVAFIIGKESDIRDAVTLSGEQSRPYGGKDAGSVLLRGDERSDADTNYYNLAMFYNWPETEAGLLLRYQRIAQGRSVSVAGFHEDTVNLYVVSPYFRSKLGPVALEGELHHVFGQYKRDLSGFDDRRVEVLNAYLDAQADLGKFYVGGTLAYVSGNDPNTDVQKRIGLDGGDNWNPCLIMWNATRNQWAGALQGHSGLANDGSTVTSTFGTPMMNAWFFQARGGFRPVENLDIGLSLSYANAVVKPTNDWLYNDYGWEVDLTGTYKINNNLSYVMGGAYLFTGKFFKGNSDANEIQDDYMLLHKLTLTF